MLLPSTTKHLVQQRLAGFPELLACAGFACTRVTKGALQTTAPSDFGTPEASKQPVIWAVALSPETTHNAPLSAGQPAHERERRES